MSSNEEKQKPEKSAPKPSDFEEKRGKMDRVPCKEDIRRILDTHPPPDKPPKK